MNFSAALVTNRRVAFLRAYQIRFLRRQRIAFYWWLINRNTFLLGNEEWPCRVAQTDIGSSFCRNCRRTQFDVPLVSEYTPCLKITVVDEFLQGRTNIEKGPTEPFTWLSPSREVFVPHPVFCWRVQESPMF
jgi:hypothetical protein